MHLIKRNANVKNKIYLDNEEPRYIYLKNHLVFDRNSNSTVFLIKRNYKFKYTIEYVSILFIKIDRLND